MPCIKRQVLAQGHRHAGVFELNEEADEHTRQFALAGAHVKRSLASCPGLTRASTNGESGATRTGWPG